MMVLCPMGVDTPMHYTRGSGAPVDKITVSPAVPSRECRMFLSNGLGNNSVLRYVVQVFIGNFKSVSSLM